MQYGTDDPKIGLVMQKLFKIDGVLFAVQQDCQHRRADDTRDQRRHSRADCPPLKDENEERVAANVDQIHHQRDQQGDHRIAHCTEGGGVGRLDREKRKGQRDEKEITQRALHDVRLDRAEQQIQQRMTAEDDGHRDQKCDARGGVQKLLGGGAGTREVLAPQRLRHDDRAARDQRGEDEHE